MESKSHYSILEIHFENDKLPMCEKCIQAIPGTSLHN